jgi:hypothetical protein
MRRALLTIVLVACGPVLAPQDDGTTGHATTSTSALTTATTQTTATGSSAGTAIPTDEATSIEPTSNEVDATDVDDESSAGHGFILEDVQGGGSVECDVWAQDCAVGNKCMPWANDGGDAWNATRCSPIDPTPAGIGDPCVVEDSGVSGFDDCGISAMCWDVDPVTLEGTCVQFCDGSEANPLCPEGLTCRIAFEGTLALCLPPCDPLLPMCAEDEACMYFGTHYGAGFACLPTPPFVPAAYGEACDHYLQLCASGLACVLPEHVPSCADIRCCTTVGELSQMPVCPDAMQTCIPFDETMPDAGLCYCGVSP